jgi:6-pyruvoyltetrahydropterin/6-carboxytetrahydropterin synthase
MKMELRKTFQFEAAHLLPHLPEDHKCRRLHGHSFQVEVVVAGEVDAKLGWVMDYAEITQAFQPLWKQLDHYYLNEIPGLEIRPVKISPCGFGSTFVPRCPC